MKVNNNKEMKQITIGDKGLMSITEEDVLKIIEIEGCCPSLDYWNPPITKDFCNTMFSDTVFLIHYSRRKEDHVKSRELVFFLNCKEFMFHYHEEGVDSRYHSSRELSMKSIKYLIQQGYDLPIY